MFYKLANLYIMCPVIRNEMFISSLCGLQRIVQSEMTLPALPLSIQPNIIFKNLGVYIFILESAHHFDLFPHMISAITIFSLPGLAQH
jgi:hypothetical protein